MAQSKGPRMLGGIMTKKRIDKGEVWDKPVTIKRKVVSALIRRLREHALGRLKDDGTRVFPAMTMTQLRAAEMLLARSVPVLSSVEMDVKGEFGNYDISDKPLTIEEWEKEAADLLAASSRPPDSTH